MYNDSEQDNTIRLLTDYHSRHKDSLECTTMGKAHIIWVGDFNRHHPLWDSPKDMQLFTNEAMDAAKKLIEAIMDTGLELALPSGIPMHEHNVTKHWSRLDQVFLSTHSKEVLTTCNTLLEQRGINTDHLPILTELRLEVAITEAKAIPNFRSMNWDDFRDKLRKQLDKVQEPARILNQVQLNEHCEELTEALQEAIRAVVLAEKPMSKSKRWWTKELLQL